MFVIIQPIIPDDKEEEDNEDSAVNMVILNWHRMMDMSKIPILGSQDILIIDNPKNDVVSCTCQMYFITWCVSAHSAFYRNGSLFKVFLYSLTPTKQTRELPVILKTHQVGLLDEWKL